MQSIQVNSGDSRCAWYKGAVSILSLSFAVKPHFAYWLFVLRVAALLYRTGLGMIVPGSILPNFFNQTIAIDAPEEVAKQYFILLINLAQAFLNLPPRDMHKELAAMGASIVSAILLISTEKAFSFFSF